MHREQVTPRPDWRERCEEIGFPFHSIDGVYWDERYCYRFTSQQIDILDDATAELHQMCLQAAERIVRDGSYERLAIPRDWCSFIEASWRAKEPHLFGRFDFAYDGKGPPKLLEYNADTPTALIEASVVQWDWLQQVLAPANPDVDQFNSIHEKLIARWPVFQQRWPDLQTLHFACVHESEEDLGNLEYLRDTAIQAGLATAQMFVEDIGLVEEGSEHGGFIDLDRQEIRHLFKLYPWEWLVREPFGEHLKQRRTQLIEPAWKMLLSNKGLLPILWDMFPGHPNLLPASFDRWRISGDMVQKPLLSREGGNVTIYRGGDVVRQDGGYGAEGYVYQQYAPIPRFGEPGDPWAGFATIGAWVIGDQPAGIGIREDECEITKNTSRFIPHYFV